MTYLEKVKSDLDFALTVNDRKVQELVKQIQELDRQIEELEFHSSKIREQFYIVRNAYVLKN